MLVVKKEFSSCHCHDYGRKTVIIIVEETKVVVKKIEEWMIYANTNIYFFYLAFLISLVLVLAFSSTRFHKHTCLTSP